MPDPLELPKKLRVKGWKVKLHDNERLEPPHVTIIRREKVWRIGLRDKDFMVPPGGHWRDIDPDLRAIIEDHWETLCDAWDRKYPTNPVLSEEDEDDGD